VSSGPTTLTRRGRISCASARANASTALFTEAIAVWRGIALRLATLEKRVIEPCGESRDTAYLAAITWLQNLPSMKRRAAAISHSGNGRIATMPAEDSCAVR